MMSGQCVYCGCTDERACPGGCAWVDENHTLCTRCAQMQMNPYEVVNGWKESGEVRVYTWAASEQDALDQASTSFQREATARGYDVSYTTNLTARLLFEATDIPFCTKPSSEGWEIWDE